jgi:hypothetical protein
MADIGLSLLFVLFVFLVPFVLAAVVILLLLIVPVISGPVVENLWAGRADRPEW